MGLLSSIFSRAKPAADAPSDTDASDSVARARRRARQRLLGAVVLVGVGIIGFPLLFETQPRPIPVDVPIEIPARDSVAPLRQPDQRATGRVSAVPAQPATVITETAAEAGLTADRGGPGASREPEREAVRSPERTVERPAPALAEREQGTDRTSTRPAEKAPAPAVAAVKPPAAAKSPGSEAAAEREEAARARALLEGKVPPSEAASGTRYIVQIGAFADPALARATRLKVERLGMVTYTHVARTPQGERTRVRVGPVASREEAEKLAARIKAAGLPTAILTL